jgi:hypothetical protein
MTFPFGPPPTPEEAAAMKRAQLEARAAAERQQRAMLPHLIEAQDAIREAIRAGLNVDNHHGRKARGALARLIDDVEAYLCWRSRYACRMHAITQPCRRDEDA